MIIRSFLICISIVPSIVHGQQLNLKTLDADSCHVALFHVVTKEMSRSEDEVHERELKRVSLSNSEMGTFIKRLRRKSSYQDGRALLTHHNFVVDFFKDGEVSFKAYISTMTGNINVVESITYQKGFYSRVSDKFSQYLMKFLADHEMLSFFDEIDLGGLVEIEP